MSDNFFSENFLENTEQKTNEIDILKLRDQIIETLKTVFDPEIPVNIYDLGLIYDLIVDENAYVTIKMTLTTPMCPVAQTFPQTVQDKVLTVPSVSGVTVDLVWEPPWTQDKMTEVAKLQLNLF